MSVSESTSMVEVLTPIWRRVLGQSRVGPDDDFFDLAGDPARARALFAEIARVCGREYPPATICYGPTISALSAILEQPEQKPLAPIVLLKSGLAEKPVFMTYGSGGSVLDLAVLARRIQTMQAVYGMQLKGLDGLGEPMDRIEDIAEYYLGALRQVQPHGPYFFIGYSFGGLVMLEIAQRLSADGETVALLTMLDSYPHLQNLPTPQRIRVMARRATRHVSKMASLPLREAVSYVGRRWSHRSRISQVANEGAQSNSDQQTSHQTPGAQAAHRQAELLREKTEVALSRYRPAHYRGTIRFVKSKIDSFYPVDPLPVWAHLATHFEFETLPGTHLTMLTEHFAELASLLSRYLREADVRDNL
jgi:thioesterase domain-containing protein